MIEVDYKLLPQSSLDNLISAAVIREGTDYGVSEMSFEDKKDQLRRALEDGRARILFEEETASVEIVSVDVR